jgi:hypothetical protein
VAAVALDEGDAVTARQYATRCHTSLLQTDQGILKHGLLDLIAKNCPTLCRSNIQLTEKPGEGGSGEIGPEEFLRGVGGAEDSFGAEVASDRSVAALPGLYAGTYRLIERPRACSRVCATS